MKVNKSVICLSLLLLMVSLILLVGNIQANSSVTFTATELLGCPTSNSVTVNIIPSSDGWAYFEYGTVQGNYPNQTSPTLLKNGIPTEIIIGGLSPDTQYYYRMESSLDSFSWVPGEEHSFHTQRASGTNFVFTVDADPHFDGSTNLQKVSLTFQNILNEHPDFNIDLGDTFMSEKMTAPTYSQVVSNYIDKRNYFDIFGNSAPLYLTMGNHEGESGWLLDGTANILPVWATQARKLYYANPCPDSFYSGDSVPEPFVGLRENYYAWQWGDALFVVLDPFWYTQSKTSGWDWTLGRTQYDWFKSTLVNSQAKFKFVFIHNLVGGMDLGEAGKNRGGAEAAMFYEWGGQNGDGTWGFDTYRSGWGKPIHQLMVENKVTIFFHGHDHFYAKQDLDGVVYQLCPQPGSTGEKDHAAAYGYANGVFLGSSGHIKVTVSGDRVITDYIKTYLPGQEPSGHQNGEIAYSYTITANPSANPPTAPTSLTATTGSSAQINLGWQDNSNDESGFKIERGTGTTYTQVATTGANSTSYSDKGLSPGTKYYYRVRAYNANGNSNYSNEASATTASTTPPDFSISASPTSQSVLSGQSAKFTVTLSPINGYKSSVRLAVSGLPSGATYKWSSNPVTLKSSGVNSVLTVTTSRVQKGTYTLNISATGSDTAKTTHTTTITLAIN